MMTMLTPFENTMEDMWNDMDMMPRFSEIPTNIKEDAEGYTIELAVPGLERKNFKLKVHNGNLCMKVRKGHKFSWPWQKNHIYIRSERHLQIPADVEAKNISARVEDGIMYIRLPKKESYIDHTSTNSNSNGMHRIQVA